MITVDVARSIWQHTIEEKGGHCPVCERWGKVYSRAINSTMAHSLIWLCSAPANEDGWVDVPNHAPRAVIRSNQLPTLAWWDLVERLENKDSKQKHSGMWRPTQKGFDFVHKGIQVPKTVYTYNNNVEAFGVVQIKIEDCFKEQFDYQQIMNDCFPRRIANELL